MSAQMLTSLLVKFYSLVVVNNTGVSLFSFDDEESFDDESFDDSFGDDDSFDDDEESQDDDLWFNNEEEWDKY